MKCILHIGTEKTATSTIQQFLQLNRAELSGQGVSQSECLGKPCRIDDRLFSAYFSARFDDFHLQNGIRSKDDKERFFAGFWDRFEAEATRLGDARSCDR